MMNYDPLQAEKDWRSKAARPVKPNRVFPERHCFPHRLVRLRLSEALAAAGCGNGSRVLDIGCGSGEDLEYISQVSGNITGVDVSAEAIEAFRARGFMGVVADVKALPFPDDSFDYVICSAILHHLVGQSNLINYLEEFKRVTRQGGYLLALEPNAFNISGMLMNIANTVKPGITGLVPHERALSPLYLKKVFTKAGLTKVRCITASYTWNRYPLWVSRIISKHENTIRYKKPFCYLGWFCIISGQKT
jgi:ubiquinone/menaquinone biosynthesis C-methylase UbiE